MKYIFSLIAEGLIAAFLAFVLVYSLGFKTTVIGVSMEPSLYHSQEVFINRFAYMLFSPKKGDIVAFWPNGNKNNHIYIKRVVGVPGEKLEIRNGFLYVDGVRQEDDFDKIAEPGIAASPVSLGPREYFVLGDNRNNSEDSRYPNIGIVTLDDMLGRAWFKLARESSGMGLVK